VILSIKPIRIIRNEDCHLKKLVWRGSDFCGYLKVTNISRVWERIPKLLYLEKMCERIPNRIDFAKTTERITRYLVDLRKM